jgi:ABC-2 type transport system permease protein
MRAILIVCKNAFRRMLPFFIASLLVGVALIPIYGFFGGLYSGTTTSPIQIGFVDQDNSTTSTALRTYCQQDLDYTISPQTDSQELNDLLVNHSLSVIITVPSGFQQSLLNGESSPDPLGITYTQDYQNSAFVKANIGQYVASLRSLAGAAQGDVGRYQQMLAALPNQRPALTIQAADSSLAQKQAALSTYQQIMGFYASFSFMLLIGLALAVLDDRRRGTFARMRLTNIPVPLYIAGLALAALSLNAATLLPIVIFFLASGLGALFNVGALVLVSIPYALFSIGFAMLAGLFIGSATGMAAITVGVGVVLSMLGGLYWPINYVPKALQLLGHLTPQFWYDDALLQFCTASGATGGATGSNLGWGMDFLILLLFALLMFIIVGIRMAVRRRRV